MEWFPTLSVILIHIAPLHAFGPITKPPMVCRVNVMRVAMQRYLPCCYLNCEDPLPPRPILLSVPPLPLSRRLWLLQSHGPTPRSLPLPSRGCSLRSSPL